LLLFAFDFSRNGRFVTNIFAGARTKILVGFPGHLSLEWISLRFRLLENGLNFCWILIEVILFDGSSLRGFNFVELLANLAGFLFPYSLPLAIPLNLSLRHERDIIARGGIPKESLQPVVILLQDRVVLVIVTTRAAVRESGEDRAH